MATGGGGNQLELSKTNFRGYDEDERDLSVSQEDTETTKTVLYNFIFTRAETDNTLTTEQRASFNEAQLSSDDGGMLDLSVFLFKTRCSTHSL